MKPVVILTLMGLLLSVVEAGAEDKSVPVRYAVMIAARGISDEDDKSVLANCQLLEDCLVEAGFVQENILRFSNDEGENSSNKLSLNRQAILDSLKELSGKLTVTDELWVFILGHANANQRGYNLATKGKRLRGKELGAALDRIESRQFVFCLTRASSPLMSILHRRRRLVVTATDSPNQLNPPRLTQYLIEAWQREPESSLLRIIRRASLSTRKHYAETGLAIAEQAMMSDGLQEVISPFDGLEKGWTAEVALTPGGNPKLRVYEVNQPASMFDADQDMTVPEVVYAKSTRDFLKINPSAWKDLPVSAIGSKLPEGTDQYTSIWLEAEIQEVRVFREKYAAVIALLNTADKETNPCYHTRLLVWHEGRWTSSGHELHRGFQRAREAFGQFCTRQMAWHRQPEGGFSVDSSPYKEFLRTEAKEPEDYIIKASLSRKLILIGRGENWQTNQKFYDSLICRKEFSHRFGTIYLNLPANHQSTIEQFLSSDRLRPELIISVLKDAHWMGLPRQSLVSLCETVWKVNREVLPGNRLRVVPVGRAMAWDAIKTKEDLKSMVADPDKTIADNILADMSRKGRKRAGLFISEAAYAMLDVRYPDGETPAATVGWHLQKTLGREQILSICPHAAVIDQEGRVIGLAARGLCRTAVKSVKRGQVILPLDKGPLGQRRFDLAPMIQTQSTFSKVFDAYLYLGAKENHKDPDFIEGFYDDAFAREVDRRARLVWGHGLVDSKWVKKVTGTEVGFWRQKQSTCRRGRMFWARWADDRLRED